MLWRTVSQNRGGFFALGYVMHNPTTNRQSSDFKMQGERGAGWKKHMFFGLRTENFRISICVFADTRNASHCTVSDRLSDLII